ncbi:MAG: ribonuclease HI family protein [Patescibacteria group bacterium]|nr:ribonuclease HI family protein [Patescibacteria group bacterium]
MINIYTDGGARGNPGPAGIGVYIEDQNKNKVCELAEKIGVSTNNVAEYKAVVLALFWISENMDKIGDRKISISLDSQLVYSQIVGLYKVKNADLRDLLFKIRELEAKINREIRYINIPREKNKMADKLVNMALDNTFKSS